MTLADAKAGEHIRVDSIGQSSQTSDIIRLGITVGSELTVAHKVRRGPIVVDTGVSEIAMGYALARRIVVSRLS